MKDRYFPDKPKYQEYLKSITATADGERIEMQGNYFANLQIYDQGNINWLSYDTDLFNVQKFISFVFGDFLFLPVTADEKLQLFFMKQFYEFGKETPLFRHLKKNGVAISASSLKKNMDLFFPNLYEYLFGSIWMDWGIDADAYSYKANVIERVSKFQEFWEKF
jgi:hypothetical protein